MEEKEIDYTPLEEALKVYMLPKLEQEGYFSVKQCFDHLPLNVAQERVANYINSLLQKKKFKNAQNISALCYESLSKESYITANNLKEMPLSKVVSEAIIYIYLTKSNMATKNNFKKDDYGDILFNCLKNVCNNFEENYEVIYLTKALKPKKTKKGSGYIFIAKINSNSGVTEPNLDFVKIENISNFLDSLKTSIHDSTNSIFFRGHSDINYICEPSVFRENFTKNENKMFQEILISCHEYFEKCSTHFDFISLMQHYNLPTRLLDITLNPLVALYFACESSKGEGELVVFRLNDSVEEIESKNKIKLSYDKNEKVAILSSLAMFSYEEQKNYITSMPQRILILKKKSMLCHGNSNKK